MGATDRTGGPPASRGIRRAHRHGRCRRSLYHRRRCAAASSPRPLPTRSPAYFDVDAVPEQLLDRGPNYNTAPTTDVLVVYEDGSTRQLDAFRWGLVPSWAKDIKIGARMINARAETVADQAGVPAGVRRPALHHPGRRLLRVDHPARPEEEAAVLHPPSRRRALRVRRAVGALEGRRRAQRGGGHRTPSRSGSCSIITTTANEPMAELHDRMPVILPAIRVGRRGSIPTSTTPSCWDSCWCPRPRS